MRVIDLNIFFLKSSFIPFKYYLYSNEFSSFEYRSVFNKLVSSFQEINPARWSYYIDLVSLIYNDIRVLLSIRPHSSSERKENKTMIDYFPILKAPVTNWSRN